MSTPRTSVIMPVYKTADRVIGAIESVLAQTDPDFELLVLIDGSPDDSSQRISHFLEENPDPRVRVFDNPVNKGVSAVRNQGLQEAQGSWIAFLDSDDRYLPGFLETMHTAVQRERADVAVSGHALVEIDGSKRDRFRGQAGVLTGQQATLGLLTDKMTPYVWDKLVSARLLEQAYFPEDIHRAEDAVFCATLYAQANRVVVLPNILYLYQVDTNGLTWGRVTPVQESLRLVHYMEQAAEPALTGWRGQQAMDTSRLVTFLNNAQQALMAQGGEADRVIEACRRQIKLGQLLRVAPVQPVYALAGSLLALTPPLYKILYRMYVQRQYGM